MVNQSAKRRWDEDPRKPMEVASRLAQSNRADYVARSAPGRSGGTMEYDSSLTPVQRRPCATRSETTKIMMRTSETHPLWIDAVEAGPARG